MQLIVTKVDWQPNIYTYMCMSLYRWINIHVYTKHIRGSTRGGEDGETHERELFLLPASRIPARPAEFLTQHAGRDAAPTLATSSSMYKQGTAESYNDSETKSERTSHHIRKPTCATCCSDERLFFKGGQSRSLPPWLALVIPRRKQWGCASLLFLHVSRPRPRFFSNTLLAVNERLVRLIDFKHH